MKKVTFLLLAAIALLGTSSCKKDRAGYYLPDEKIHKIYYSVYHKASDGTADTVGRYMRQRWTWNGKFLTKVEHFNEKGDVVRTEQYSYRGERLAKVSIPEQNAYWDFSYSGKEFKRIDLYVNGEDVGRITFDYDEGLVSSATLQFDADVAMSKNIKLPQGVKLFPTEQAAQIAEEALAQAPAEAKSGVAVTVSYEWDRFNVVKLVVPSVMDWHVTTSVLTMDYDDRTSPYYGLVSGVESFAGGSVFSRNNVVKLVDSREGLKNTHLYTYEYNGIGFPTKMVETTSYVYSGVTHDYQRVAEYEYDD